MTVCGAAKAGPLGVADRVDAQVRTAEIPMYGQPRKPAANLLMVSVGNGPPARVLLDTGSTGLRILASQIGPAVERTDRQTYDEYGDGTILRGYVGRARIAFPEADHPVATAEPIDIEVITEVSCKQGAGRCPGLSGDRVGIMGVAFHARDTVFNPLAQLPGNLGQGFIVDLLGDRPHLRVGLTPEHLRDYVFWPMRALPSRGPTAPPAWDSASVNACYRVDDYDAGCYPVIFDTGADSMHFEMPAVDRGWLGRGGHLHHGRQVAMRIGDRLAWRFVNGPMAPVKAKHERRSNSGLAFFRHFRVAFDSQNGRLGLWQAGHDR